MSQAMEALQTMAGNCAAELSKWLAFLLEYPHQEGLAGAEFAAVLADIQAGNWTLCRNTSGLDTAEATAEAEGLVVEQVIAAVARLVSLSDEERCRLYVDSFDFTADHSLYLTAHEYGDSRERGPALLYLHQVLASQGWREAEGELADYLPLWLEYFAVETPSLATRRVADRLAAMCRNIAMRLGEDHPYQPLVFAAALLLQAFGTAKGAENDMQAHDKEKISTTSARVDAEVQMPFPLFFD